MPDLPASNPAQVAQQHAFVAGQAQATAMAAYDLGASLNLALGALTFLAQLPVDMAGPAGKIRDAATEGLASIRRVLSSGIVTAPGLTLVKP